MLEFHGPGRVHTCDGLSRRDFLQVGTLGAVGLGMTQWETLKASGAVDTGRDVNGIMIFNLGAPSQLDTWDMKPSAPAEIRGPFSPIATSASGISISEMFPGMARHGDKISYVRTVYHTAAAVHDTGHQMMQTGRLFSGGLESPHVGCVLGYLKGRKTDLPPFVVLPEKMGPTGGNLPHGQEAGSSLAPSQAAARVMQERAGSPSMSTVQAPQMPCSQPRCVPVRSSPSRRKSARGVRASTASDTGLPFTVRRIGCLVMGVLLMPPPSVPRVPPRA